MQDASIAKIEIVPLRDAFRHEAGHFTTWLEKNIDALADRLQLPLLVVQREKQVGDFNVDLLCEDDSGHPVIIENQLERTDHNHLGQLLTYLVNLEAKTAVWITAEARQEHQQVITWLNEATPEDTAFYLVRVEAIRIGASPFAPLFTVLVGPDHQLKDVGRVKKEWADSHSREQEFWTSLFARSRTRQTLFSNKTPTQGRWITVSAGRPELYFGYRVLQDSGRVELAIFQDVTGQIKKTIFDALYAQKESIEQVFGGPLEWQRLDDQRVSHIKFDVRSGGFASPETWPRLQEDMIEAMIRLERAMAPHIANLTV